MPACYNSDATAGTGGRVRLLHNAGRFPNPHWRQSVRLWVSRSFPPRSPISYLSTAGATNLLLVTFLIPVSAIILGVLVLGETLAPKHIGGMALIALGLASIDGRPGKALHRLTSVARRH